MTSISRREFFTKTATDAALVTFLALRARDLHANPLGMPIGCQTWPVRTMIVPRASRYEVPLAPFSGALLTARTAPGALR